MSKVSLEAAMFSSSDYGVKVSNYNRSELNSSNFETSIDFTDLIKTEQEILLEEYSEQIGNPFIKNDETFLQEFELFKTGGIINKFQKDLFILDYEEDCYFNSVSEIDDNSTIGENPLMIEGLSI